MKWIDFNQDVPRDTDTVALAGQLSLSIVERMRSVLIIKLFITPYGIILDEHWYNF
jgi:hypothetical protein